MPRQGLNREAVTAAAIRLIEEKGISDFSLNELAKSLDIKPASLYSHIESIDGLFTDIGFIAVRLMVSSEKEAIKGKTRDEALFALASAYRKFAKEHYELYLLVMNIPKGNNPVLEMAAGEITEPILEVLNSYNITREMQMHFQRSLRSMMHGFVAHEEYGAFTHFPIERDKSYEISIHIIAESLHRLEGENIDKYGK
ncbi:MAG: TetR/AcrR family transcriptional regulator [Oscillospiraceae bacterium]|jgi:AcrR family transcriptional regulator